MNKHFSISIIVLLLISILVYAALIDNQIAYYKFDGDLTDATGNFNGVNDGSTNLVSGKINQGRSFDGSSVVKTGITKGDLFDANNAATWNYWIKTTQTTRFIFGMISSGDGTDWIQINHNRNTANVPDYMQIIMRENSAGGSSRLYFDTDNTIGFNDGNWHMITVTISDIDTSNPVIHIYVDAGDKAGTYTNRNAQNSYNSDTEFYIGAYNEQDSSKGFAFTGDIDEFAVWNRALSQADVTELYNSNAGLQYPYVDALIIINATYNMTSDGGCINWRTDQDDACDTTDNTPTVIFDSNIASDFSIRVSDSDSATFPYNINFDCDTTGGTSHVCIVYNSELLTKGTYYIYVSGTDGVTTTTSGSLNITRLNDVPVIQTSTTVPNGNINTSDDIQGWCNVTDGNNDTIQYFWNWYNNSILHSSGNDAGGNTQGVNTNLNTISSSLTSIGDSWEFECRGYDGTAYSSWLNSSAVIVTNNIPVTQTATTIPTETALISEDIQGYCNITDAEATTLTYEYKWLKDGVLYSTGSVLGVTQGLNINVNNLSSSLTSGKEEWILSCRGYDEYDYGLWLESAGVSILCDGTKIDVSGADTLQSVIDDVGTVAGDTLFVLDSTVDNDLIVNKEVCIFGNDLANISGLEITADNVYIKDFYIDGVLTNYPTNRDSTGISITGDNVTIKGSEFTVNIVGSIGISASHTGGDAFGIRNTGSGGIIRDITMKAIIAGAGYYHSISDGNTGGDSYVIFGSGSNTNYTDIVFNYTQCGAGSVAGASSGVNTGGNGGHANIFYTSGSNINIDGFYNTGDNAVIGCNGGSGDRNGNPLECVAGGIAGTLRYGIFITGSGNTLKDVNLHGNTIGSHGSVDCDDDCMPGQDALDMTVVSGVYDNVTNVSIYDFIGQTGQNTGCNHFNPGECKVGGDGSAVVTHIYGLELNINGLNLHNIRPGTNGNTLCVGDGANKQHGADGRNNNINIGTAGNTGKINDVTIYEMYSGIGGTGGANIDYGATCTATGGSGDLNINIIGNLSNIEIFNITGVNGLTGGSGVDYTSSGGSSGDTAINIFPLKGSTNISIHNSTAGTGGSGSCTYQSCSDGQSGDLAIDFATGSLYGVSNLVVGDVIGGGTVGSGCDCSTYAWCGLVYAFSDNIQTHDNYSLQYTAFGGYSDLTFGSMTTSGAADEWGVMYSTNQKFWWASLLEPHTMIKIYVPYTTYDIKWTTDADITGNFNLYYGSTKSTTDTAIISGTYASFCTGVNCVYEWDISALPAAKYYLMVNLTNWAATEGAENTTNVYSSSYVFLVPDPDMAQSIITTTNNDLYADNDLLGWCNATDLDGTPVSYDWKWYKDGSIFSSSNSSAQTEGILYNVENIPASSVSVGDVWVLECNASNIDGTAFPLNSSSTTISAYPIVTNTARTSPAVTTRYDLISQIIGYCNASNVETTNIYYQYEWLRDGIQYAIGNTTGNYTQGIEYNVNNLTLPANDIGLWNLTCTGYDSRFGVDVGTPVTSATLSIQNVSITIDGSGDIFNVEIANSDSYQLEVNATIIGETVCIDYTDYTQHINWSCSYENISTIVNATSSFFRTTINNESESSFDLIFSGGDNQTFYITSHQYDEVQDFSFNMSATSLIRYVDIYINNTLVNSTFILAGDKIVNTFYGSATTATLLFDVGAGFETDYIYLEKDSNVTSASINLSGDPYDYNYETQPYIIGRTLIITDPDNDPMEQYTVVQSHMNITSFSLRFAAEYTMDVTMVAGTTLGGTQLGSCTFGIIASELLEVGSYDWYNCSINAEVDYLDEIFIGVKTEAGTYAGDTDKLTWLLGSNKNIANNGFLLEGRNNGTNYTSYDAFFKLNGTGDFPKGVDFFVGSNTTAFDSTPGLLTTERMIDGFMSDVNNYLTDCTADSSGFCNVPLLFYSEGVGVINLTHLNIETTVNGGTLHLDTSDVDTFLDTVSGYTNIPMRIKSDTAGTITVSGILYDYLGGNDTFTMLAHNPSYTINLTRDLKFYYTDWDYELPTGLTTIVWYPWSPTAKNVEPFGQSNAIPILDITNYGYGSPSMNWSMYVGNQGSKCVTIKIANSNDITTAVQVNDSLYQLLDEIAYENSNGIWIWADLSCSYTNWQYWQPDYHFRSCTSNYDLCNEALV